MTTAVGAPAPLLRATRPRQWPKNLLVFAAPIAAGSVLVPEVLAGTLIALISMVLASASTYLWNDLLDAESDRKHPIKMHRPIASGEVTSTTAVVGALALAGVALAIPLTSGRPALAIVVLAYLLVQALYFTWAKAQPVFDLACVAAGFVLRAVAGGAASDIPISSWFLTVTASVAVFVVAGKRYSELVSQGAGSRPALKEYSQGYLRFVWSVSAAVAISFYALWANELVDNGAEAVARFSIIPFALLLLRYARDIDGARAEAPERVVLSDPEFIFLVALWVGLFLLQTWL